VDNPAGQLDAAAAGAELVELELEPLDEVELDFSDDEELVDSELAESPLDELDELFAEVLADSRLSVR
jgi:antitoxin component of MazEF toxin-antitoxin module